MSLELVPTEEIVEELSKRYPNGGVISCIRLHDGQDALYQDFWGSPIVVKGLVQDVREKITMCTFSMNPGVAPDDLP